MFSDSCGHSRCGGGDGGRGGWRRGGWFSVQGRTTQSSYGVILP